MLKYIVLVPLAVLASAGVARAEVGGSYQSTCENIQQRGPFLSAECRTVDGDYRRSSIDVRGCNGGVSNSNGRLTCGRGGGDGYDRGQGFDRGRGYDNGYGAPRPRNFRPPNPDDDEN